MNYNILTDKQFQLWSDYVNKYDIMDYGHATRIKAWFDFCSDNNIDPKSRLRHA